jgi:3-deoxy-manno-octulosonate cytidylyltransferase (CMP-KDO synthetase)
MMKSTPEGNRAAFTVLIPARMESTRLPGKPLIDIAGLPMVVRVARRAMASGAQHTLVVTDSDAIALACNTHGVQSLMTRADHLCGSDRLAEACELLGLADASVVVNVQGDEPLVSPDLIASVAEQLHLHPTSPMATAAHPIASLEEFLNSNVVKVVVDATGQALYFSRAPIPHCRSPIGAQHHRLPDPAPLRHVGLYAYRAGFLREFPRLPMAPLEQTESLEQLRVLWHGHSIRVHITDTEPGLGVDTPEDLARVRKILT